MSVLQFGEPPRALESLERPIESAERDLVDYVTGLYVNAEEFGDSDPASSAMCFHEAGRALERRMGRPLEAWCCYSRALEVSQGYGVALRGLARLARAAADWATLRRILECSVEESEGTAARVPLTAEKAAREILDGDVGDAIDTLRSGLNRAPAAAPLRALMLGLAGANGDDGDLSEALDTLSRGCDDPALEAALEGAFLAVEERRGRVDEALARSRRAFDARGGAPDAAWALARLALKAGDTAAASSALQALERTAGSDSVKAACARIGMALRTCAVTFESQGGREAGSAPPVAAAWDLAFVAAVRSADGGAEASAARIAKGEVTTSWLADGFDESALLGGGPGPVEPGTQPAAASGGSRRRALAALLNPDDREDAEALFAAVNDAPALALHAALAGGRHEIASSALGVMLADASNDAAVHELAVARAVLLRNAARDPEAALEVLQASSPTPATAPLASLIRLHRRVGPALAEVALAEAAGAEDARARSWSLAWAARHLADSDPGRAEELYGESLRENPTCGMALHALERIGGNHTETARAWIAAASSCTDDSARCADLITAGIHFALGGELVRAGQAFGGAARIARDDKTLGIVAQRLAAAGAEPGLAAGGVDLALEDGLSPDDVLAVASSCLRREPQAALRAFEWLRGIAPGDPVAERGLTDARLACGRWSEVSGALFERLRVARSKEEEAFVYARMAELDEHFGKNESSAMLSLIEVARRLPGHRPTLGALAIYFARQEREEELADALLNVALALEDDRDAAAAAAAAFRLSPQSTDAIRTYAFRSPTSIYAAAELEARTEVPEERLECLRRLAEGSRAAAVNVSRLADALEDAGAIDAALVERTRAIEVSPESLYDLLGLERLQRAVGDGAGLLWTLRRMAELTVIAGKRQAYLLEGARIASDEVGDVVLAGQLALGVLREDPKCEEAYSLARRLMSGIKDLAFDDDVLEARIAGRENPVESRELLIELSEVRERRGDANGAKDALERIVALYPADVDTRRALSGLRQRDGEWAEAIAHLLEAARYTQEDPVAGVDLFYELGTLYQLHSDRMDLAEKCYVKVLGWDRTRFDAMERLSEVYAAMQNWPRAAQALEHLVAMSADPSVRTEKTVALTEVLDRHLNRQREAEQMLNDARRATPLDIRPVESLAAIYTRQRDSLALNVLLDQALVTNANAVNESPDEPGLYANLLAITSMKGDDDLAAMAETALVLSGGQIPERYRTNRAEPWWNVGARVGEGSIDDFLCPKEVTPGFRGTLAVVEEAVSKLLGLSAKHVAASGTTRLDKKHAFAQMLAQYAPMFGVRGEPTAFAEDIQEIRVAPGAPPAIIVPLALAAVQDEAVLRFAAAAALGLSRMGLGLATVMTNEQLRLLAACCVKLSVPSFDIGGIDPKVLALEIERLRPAVSGKLVERIQPLAFDCGAALEHPHLRDSVATVGHRTGFVATGTLSAAVTALRIVSGRTAVPFGQVPGVGRLMSFVFSKDHIELRQRMGI
jgi:tetratricopeptide (TPR) repeat protein